MITATATPTLEVPLDGGALGAAVEEGELVEPGAAVDGELVEPGEDLETEEVVFVDKEELEPAGVGITAVLKVSFYKYQLFMIILFYNL